MSVCHILGVVDTNIDILYVCLCVCLHMRWTWVVQESPLSGYAVWCHSLLDRWSTWPQMLFTRPRGFYGRMNVRDNGAVMHWINSCWLLEPDINVHVELLMKVLWFMHVCSRLLKKPRQLVLTLLTVVLGWDWELNKCDNEEESLINVIMKRCLGLENENLGKYKTLPIAYVMIIEIHGVSKDLPYIR